MKRFARIISTPQGCVKPGSPKNNEPQINTDENYILLPFSRGGWEGLISTTPNPSLKRRGDR